MKLETFFEKFELFADAPNAVGKMRELVVDLAVRGQLVPNDPGEAPVRLNMNADSENSSIPPNWRSGILGDAIQLEYGDNLPAGKRSGSGEYPVYGSNGIVGTHDSFLTKEPAIIVGRKGSAGALNIANGPSWTTDVAYFVRPPSDLDLRFTYYLLSSLHLDELGKGIKPGLSRKEAYVLPISLPPLAEQKRIVAKVDELMALCDRLEAQQQERDTRHAALTRASLARFAEAPTPANLDFLFHKFYRIPPADLRRTILTLAVQGLLVPRGSQSADWGSRKLKKLTTKIGSGSTPAGGKESYQEAGVPLIRSMNVHFGGFVRDGLAFLNEDQAEKLKNVTVQADDVLLNITGASIGRVTTAPKDMEGARVNQHVCIVRPTPEILPKFLEMFLASPVVQNLIDDVQVGATREALTKAMIEQFEIPVPPLAEQAQILAKVDQLMDLVDRLDTQLSEARIKSAALLDAVVHELLNPTAEIIDLATYRAAVGCYAVNRLHAVPTFGRTAAMKVLYLAEAHVGVPMKLQPRRHFAGPYDEWIERFDEQAAEVGWFTVTERALPGGKSKFDYHPGLALAEQTTLAARLLTSEQRSEFDRLLDLFASKTTEDAEIIATLFAAWNDFLIDGHTPSDDEIIEEVRERWHESKRRFSPVLLCKWLDWLRQNDLVPKGRAPRTAHQTQLLLN